MEKNLNNIKGQLNFISNEILKTNIALTMQYIIELNEISKKEINIKSFIYKTIIIYSASIIEAVLHYYLQNNIKKEILEKEWTYSDIRILHEIKKNEQIIAGRRFKKKIKIKKNIDFKKINEISLKFNIIDKIFFDKFEKVRKLRNRIHLSGLNNIDYNYNKKTLSFVFDSVREALDIIQTKSLQIK